ncbi:restriction endonuclease subunit S [Asanoa sp. NPDC049518]|uniref:restriction endonuclease subunit S n=1 Tax=unclassified Asanoa TaxID=2685164 RepID=UPI003425D0A8
MTAGYTEYVDSGVPWLGAVPAGWTMRPLWSMFERLKDIGHPDERMLSVFRDYGVVAKDSRDNINKTAENRNIYQLVHPGWLVTNRMKAWQGSVGISSLRGIVSGHYICFAPRHDADSRYLNWLFRSPAYATGYALQSRGVRIGQAEIDNDLYRVMPVLLPPIEEQRAIADYLDRETAQIDTLIEEQRRLIEMLRDRRADLISHTVLDATSERTRLRRLVDVIDCAHVTAEFVDDDQRYPVASIRECQAATVDLSACNYTTAEFFEHLRAAGRAPRAGDLLFIRNVSVGLVSVVAPGLPEFAIGQETVLLRRKSDVHPTFLRYALVGAEARHAIEAAMIGSTFRRINVSAIRSLPVPTPPIDEQHRIATYLDQQTAKIDELIAETERFIDLVRERRAALITAVVTGQFDVREIA